MALFEDIIQGLGGVAQVASGIGTLRQPGVEAIVRTPPPMPSSAELTNLQIAQAIQQANLQAAGYDVSPGEGGAMTLTPRLTPGEVLAQQLGGAGPGLQRELSNLGPQPTALGGQLNTQALAGARGTSQLNRAALIQAIQQKRGPVAGLGLQAPVPTAITQGPVSSVTPFSNVPSLRQLSNQRGGGGSFLTQTLPTIAGGAAALAPLLAKLFSGGNSGGSIIQPTQAAPLTPWGIGPESAFGGDFSIDEATSNWMWVDPSSFNDFTGAFDYGLGNIFDTSV